MIIMTEAAKRRFRTLLPGERAEVEVLRLDKARATAASNGEEPKLSIYLSESEEGDPVVHEGEPPSTGAWST